MTFVFKVVYFAVTNRTNTYLCIQIYFHLSQYFYLYLSYLIIMFFSQLGFDSHVKISASNGLNIAGGKPYVILWFLLHA